MGVKCEKHPDREGVLRVELPSIGLKRYLCFECTEPLYLSFHSWETDTPYWEHELWQGVEDRRVDMLDAYHSEGIKWKAKP